MDDEEFQELLDADSPLILVPGKAAAIVSIVGNGFGFLFFFIFSAMGTLTIIHRWISGKPPVPISTCILFILLAIFAYFWGV